MPYTHAQLIDAHLKFQTVSAAANNLVEVFSITRAAENAASWSCGELDAFVRLLREIGTPEALALAKDFLEVHTEDDDEDERWQHVNI